MMSSPLAWLDSRMMFGMKAGLENMAVVCERLGNPQRKLRTIHVVGTNGKGSTSFWLMRILEAHGLHVGLFTSPHLVSMRERIRIGDEAISQADLERLIDRVRRVSLDREITFFEVLTAIAFLWFAEKGVDVVVLEAGLGGRLDSTNLVDSSLCILTSVGLDHTEILGDSLSQILEEKLGVWKSGATLFHRQELELQQEQIANRARVLSARACFVPTDSSLVLPQPGLVYQENASLALRAAKEYLQERFRDSCARESLQHAVWVGRQQELRNPQTGTVEWILDGAHNGHASLRLAETLHRLYPQKKMPLVIAVLKTKNPQELLAPLLPLASEFIFTRTPHPKMREPEELREILREMDTQVPVRCVASVPDALKYACHREGPCLCTGSLYFVGAVIEILKMDFEELQWFRQFSPSDNERA